MRRVEGDKILPRVIKNIQTELYKDLIALNQDSHYPFTSRTVIHSHDERCCTRFPCKGSM